MLILHSIDELKGQTSPTVVTIGNFDGVHLGHQQLLSRLVEKKDSGALVVLSFYPHPLEVLYPEREFHRLFSFNDQVEQLKKYPIQYFIRHPFTLDFSKISAEDFLKDWLFKYLKPKVLIVGYDFSFGSHREGSLEKLENFCSIQKCELIIVPAFQLHGEIVSSSKIRDLIKKGEMTRAKEFLGRYFHVEGEVVRGDQRGRTIGFPTANLRSDGSLKPKPGVYVTRTCHQSNWYDSMTNVGWNPTVQKNPEELKVETHLLNFDQEIYGEQIRIEFIHYLRDERKFSSLAELTTQLNKDKKSVEEFFRVQN